MMTLKTCESYVADLWVWNDSNNNNMVDRQLWYDTYNTKCKKRGIMRQTCESNMIMLKTCESNMMMLKTCESYFADLWVWNYANNTNMVERKLRYDTNTEYYEIDLWVQYGVGDQCVFCCRPMRLGWWLQSCNYDTTLKLVSRMWQTLESDMMLTILNFWYIFIWYETNYID